MDCKHEEYDMEGKHCKLSHCAKGVGMRCKKDYGEWCNCYESINSKKKHRKPDCKKSIPIVQVKSAKIEIEEKDTYAIRKDSSTNEGEFVKLLNTEMKQLVNNLFFEYVKGYCIKQFQHAKENKEYSQQESMKAIIDNDKSKSDLIWNNSAYFDGQLIAYQNVIDVLDTILDANSKSTKEVL